MTELLFLDELCPLKHLKFVHTAGNTVATAKQIHFPPFGVPWRALDDRETRYNHRLVCLCKTHVRSLFVSLWWSCVFSLCRVHVRIYL